MGTTERTALVAGATPETKAIRNGPVLMKYVMTPMFKLVPGKSNGVEDGAGRYLRVAGLGDVISGEFYASPNKKMTGELARMDLPHIADRRAQRAGWEATVRVSGVDMPALPVARPAHVPEGARAA